MMNIRFDEKVVLVTGGSAGIGLAAAELFGSLGASVAICGTNAAKLQKAADTLSARGIRVFSRVCDVAVREELEALAAETEAALGPIDVWISNAAYCPQYTLLDTEEDVWDRVMDTNIKSVYLGSRIAWQRMKDRGGVVLLASSFASLFPAVGSGAYAASKAAVSSMVKTLAAELAPYGIRVNGYIPGVIDTEMNRERIAADDGSLAAAIDMQTFGQPEDVAWAMAFLASDYARYITGTLLEISGGKMTVQNPTRAWADKERRERKEGAL